MVSPLALYAMSTASPLVIDTALRSKHNDRESPLVSARGGFRDIETDEVKEELKFDFSQYTSRILLEGRQLE